MVLVTAFLTATLAGCAGGGTAGTPGTPGQSGSREATAAPPSPAPAPALVAIYTQVLRQYLTSGDNSFGPDHFQLVFVLDTTRPDAADPKGGATTPVPIGQADQHRIIDALSGVATVRFVPDRESVLETKDRCAQVRDGGVLIVLAPPVGDDTLVTVGIHGFVACLGATWFTYVVENKLGEWRVTGKTGPYAIA